MTPARQEVTQALPLGSLEAEFQRYLCFRPDLLPLAVRSAWAGLPPSASPLSVGEVRQVVERELNSVEAGFAFLEPEPFASELCHQRHRAWLHNGEAVTVKVRRPATEALLASGSEVFAGLERKFAASVSDAAALRAAVGDFRRRLIHRMDFESELAGLRLLSADAREFAVLCAPVVHRALSTPRVLVVSQWLGSDPVTPANPSEDVADSLCFVWLRQALLGRAFPAEPGLADFSTAPHRQIVIRGGPLGHFPLETQLNLQAYLAAIAGNEPDRACEVLLREMTREHGDFDGVEFRRRFRYASPFRDGTWNEPGDDRLLDTILVHWQIAHEHGFRPNAALLQFYTGALQITAEAQRLSPRRAVFERAWQGSRSQIVLAGFRQVTKQRYWFDNFEKYSGLTSAVADSVGRLAGSGVLAPDKLLRMVEVGAAKRSSSLATTVALLLLLLSCGLLASRFGGLAGPWGETAGAILFAALGIALLRQVLRN